ncbi:TetR/AcrR family transcriptional regulator [Pseudonocardia humida]|uniref:TetR/AcrR family transcriptional regulator n=1 Tax=Pseudonocardia humida TaxID=2800819 RepID=A0ABT1A032_9PSEU|nr:TetR/AcrR family transcriptional regulator [Pseudonocardia humida]MCO1656234.1 TetR/AcrR family transcriptional regulator [Pseudonocardia humida]
MSEQRVAPADAGAVDGRLLRGARSRRAIARHAVDVASVEGLTALSIGRLAGDLGISKSGVQALFGSKENLQLAAVEAARETFLAEVLRPARAAAPGVARLRALVERWIAYVESPLYPGGCFRVANLSEFDSRPGPVRDALARDTRDWQATLAAELRRAAAAGETAADLDAELVAFQIDAVLCAANTALRLGDDQVVDKVRRVLDALLSAPAAGAAR